ncbi:MAG: hypothetical protein HY825_00450 [Acidobacteria bacterium]|nr:hypothetical protein [Acidobacteriota bacterium]
MRARAAAALLVALAAVPAPLRAAVERSPHDLISQGYDVVKVTLQQERCSRCHIASSAALQGFLPDVPGVLSPAFGPSSLVCFSCHDGTTIVSPNVDASRNAFHPASHGNDLTGYEELLDGGLDLPLVAGKRMDCITCHDPHDNSHRPFLRAGIQELCLDCHGKLAGQGLGKENRTGSHVLATNPLGPPRPEVPLEIGQAFRTGFPSPYPAEDGRGAGGWHWDLGGHLEQGVGGAMTCATCHAVHGEEGGVPAEKLLAVAPVNIVANLFCEGCHAGTRGDGKTAPAHPNPGGTTTARTYHAADDDEGNGGDRILPVREPPEWPFGGGNPRRLLCTTCHRAHGAWVETPLLRPPVTATAFCEECHDQVPAHHHKVGELADAGCSAQVPDPAYGTVRALSCSSCHRAHNAGLAKAREADYVPQLVDSLRSGAICARCHPAANPTCSPRKEYQASHFVGDPSLEATYGDKSPPVRTEAWPGTGLKPALDGEKDQMVTCLSCHSFTRGSVGSGAGATVRLVARSGDGVEWEADGEDAYLCTGCHGLKPGTAGGQKGHTHPLMAADMKREGRAPTPPVTVTPLGKVNCDSCHRPHEAITKGGYYILEAVESGNADPRAFHPEVDFTVLCHSCHDEKKY